MNNSTLSQSLNNKLYLWVVTGCALATTLVLVSIICFLFYETLPFWEVFNLSHLISETKWFPTQNQFGILPMLLGSLLVSMGAIIFSLPISIFSAIYLKYYSSHTVKFLLTRALEVFAGLPSVIFGLWGLVELVPILRLWEAPGTSILAASIVLTLMIVPTMILLIDGSFNYFPDDLFKSAHATGLDQSTIIMKFILPYCRGGIFASLVLGFGRAIGETMAVMMVAGNVVQMPESIFSSVRTLTANIALEMSYAMDSHRSVLFVCGLILVVIVSALISLIQLPGTNT